MKTLAGLILALVALIPLKPSGPLLQNLAGQLVETGPPAHQLNHTPATTLIAIPVKTGDQTLNLGASSVYAVDIDSGSLLYEHNSDVERPIASITKLVTAMVILQSHSLDETVTVGSLTPLPPEDAQLGLAAGQQFKLGDLLKAALVPSDNDAAEALAIYDSGSVAAFSVKMNSLASLWGIKHAHFVSANGLTDTDNYASARSLAQLARIALTNASFAAIVSTSSAQISDASGKSYQLASTDSLLADGRFHGIKTGYTVAAGQSFVALADVRGHRVITVVLNSPDRFGETASLVSWIERNFSWQ